MRRYRPTLLLKHDLEQNSISFSEPHSEFCRVEAAADGRISHPFPMGLGHGGCRFESVISKYRDFDCSVSVAVVRTNFGRPELTQRASGEASSH